MHIFIFVIWGKPLDCWNMIFQIPSFIMFEYKIIGEFAVFNNRNTNQNDDIFILWKLTILGILPFNFCCLAKSKRDFLERHVSWLVPFRWTCNFVNAVTLFNVFILLMILNQKDFAISGCYKTSTIKENHTFGCGPPTSFSILVNLCSFSFVIFIYSLPSSVFILFFTTVHRHSTV